MFVEIARPVRLVISKESPLTIDTRGPIVYDASRAPLATEQGHYFVQRK